MSYYHNRFNEVDRTALYQFIKHLEEIQPYGLGQQFPFGWTYADEFRKLRQVIAFAYSHGMRD